MFSVNEYFDGNVKSLAFKTENGRATIGVMAKGEYEFGTSTIEYMTVTSGIMWVQLPGETQWKTYQPFETFKVEKNQTFKVKTEGDTSYRCLYE